MQCADAGVFSFPVPPEVGKIGKDSPTFIQPVSERSDGIKSFFQKQTTSPAKPKPKTNPISHATPSKSGGPSSPERKVKGEDTKVKAGGIKSEITPKDEEKGLGDDSNAPNLASTPGLASGSGSGSGSGVKKEEPSSPSTKVPKAEKEIVKVGSDDEDKDTSTSLTKRKREEKGGAGQRTKVIRKESDDGNKAVSRSNHAT